MAQQAFPVHETRGVWLATVMQDGGWPNPEDTPASQESHLRELIQEAHQLGINTVYFQAVARGDAYYPSARLPWAPITEQAGQHPGFDPLAVAIHEAHRLGIELHAWVNVFRIGDRTTLKRFKEVNDPAHVAYAEPGWVKTFGGDLWLDPSSAAARAWVLENTLEIVERYDVDGIQFDYIRYPAGGLSNDEATFAAASRGFTEIDDWRRDNVTQFVAVAGDAIRSIKPWIKVGATPLGNYQGSPEWNALLAYNDTFQASRDWLKAGFLDYLAPQIYYSTGTAPETGLNFKSPDFNVLTAEWMEERHGRHVIPGIAAYKGVREKFPASDLLVQIATTRSMNAAGHVFFRFDDLKALAPLITDSYPSAALPPSFAFREDAYPPQIPGPLSIQHAGLDRVLLSWSPAAGAPSDPLRAYAVYRSVGRPPSLSQPADLYQVLPASTIHFADSRIDSATVFYRVVAQSRLGMMSPPSEILAVPALPIPEATTSVVPMSVLSINLPESAMVTIEVFDPLGRRHDVVQTRYPAGPSDIQIDIGDLADGLYICRLSSDSLQQTVPFIVQDSP